MHNREHRQRYAKERRLKARQEALVAYGNLCVCCGESNWQFLSIDHVNNDGAEHRKQIKRPEDMFRWLKKHNWPTGFRVLCFNCNLSRGHLGYCPHEASDSKNNCRTPEARGLDE